ncbi:MAG: ATP-binding cassette domain-containing protein [Mycoplasmataceae bacterium]|nr:ATP-binding cassette domain-containing protein [Mycoplasmataceae bacterium]
MIRVKNLSYTKDQKKILTNINLEIKKGEYISILGKNGSGKSILALVLSGLMDKTIVGYEVDSKIALVLENPDNQIIGTTVEDDIAFGLQNKQLSRNEINSKIDDVLNKFNILELRKRSVTTLSGGQKQKLSFASLFALDYEVYILDEVTSMLDPESKEMVIKLIKELHKEGKTIIQITHFMDEVKNTKRSIVMNDSKIIYDGKSTLLLKNTELLKNNNLV